MTGKPLTRGDARSLLSLSLDLSDPDRTSTAQGDPAAAAQRLADALDALTHKAPCQSTDRDVWFSETPRERAEAAEACTSCPVIAVCNEYAEAATESFGVWGGVDREAVKVERRRAAAKRRRTQGEG